MDITPIPVTLPKLPKRPGESHKGDYGKVDIISGRVGYTGAPCLAATGALRAGAGLVGVGVPRDIYGVVAGKLLCAMPYPLPCDETGGLAMGAREAVLERSRAMDAVLIGPGLGRTGRTPELVRLLIRRLACPLVLDADGINALEGHIDVLDSRRERVTVLTPHMGEFTRLLGREPRVDKAREALDFARTHGCILVLKGHRTLTACPDGNIYVNQTGNPGMASGGTGDVLAGMILSFLGQGFDPAEAARDAVYLHGLAGDLAAQALGEYALTAADLIDHLPQAMRAAGG